MKSCRIFLEVAHEADIFPTSSGLIFKHCCIPPSPYTMYADYVFDSIILIKDMSNKGKGIFIYSAL